MVVFLMSELHRNLFEFKHVLVPIYNKTNSLFFCLGFVLNFDFNILNSNLRVC